MTAFNVNYSYTTESFDAMIINADNAEQAEEFAKDAILDECPEINVATLVFDSIKEVN